MAGVGKLIKQAQKMQRKMEALQAELAEKEIEVSSGGGAIVITVTAAQVLKGLKIDPEFLKEEAELVEETLLGALNEALAKAKEVNEAEMAKVSEGFQLPGMM